MDTQLDGIRKKAEEMNIPVVSTETAGLIHLIGAMLRPSRILEVGTAVGYTSILLSDILSPSGRIDTIEKNDELAAAARKNIRNAGLDQVITVICGDALEILECLPVGYDMIFMDAAKAQYPMFLPGCLRVLNSGGVLISDNVLFNGMVAGEEPAPRKKRTIVNRLREYVKILCSNKALETVILETGDGVSVSLKKQTRNM